MKMPKTETILETAGKMFSRYGLRKTSIEEIARLARVAKATIYNHFGNKDQIYLEVLRREMQEVVDNLSSKVAEEFLPLDKLITFIKSKFIYMRKAVNILNIYRDGRENLTPEAERIRSELFDREVDILQTILEDGIKKGLFFLNYPLITARAMMHAIKGFELNWLVNESDEKIDSYISELTSILFYGIMSKNRHHEVGPLTIGP